MFLSIIIPVYNAGKYLRDCILSMEKLPSFLGINPNQIEVIFVDDGSIDSSGEICDTLSCEKSPFVVNVIHQKNQGVSVARNEGLKNAIGEWVWFIDADDYIEIPLEKNTPVVFGKENFVVTGFVWEENGMSKVYGASCGEFPYNLWRCWFKRDLILKNYVHFIPGRKYAEDQEFILKYLISLGKIESHPFPEIYYHYTMRPGSAMTRSGIKGKHTRDLFSVLSSLLFYGLIRGAWREKWYWNEMKRMTKTLIVVLGR